MRSRLLSRVSAILLRDIVHFYLKCFFWGVPLSGSQFTVGIFPRGSIKKRLGPPVVAVFFYSVKHKRKKKIPRNLEADLRAQYTLSNYLLNDNPNRNGSSMTAFFFLLLGALEDALRPPSFAS